MLATLLLYFVFGSRTQVTEAPLVLLDAQRLCRCMRTIGGGIAKSEEKLLAGEVNSSFVALVAQGMRMGDEVVLPSDNVITRGDC